jgi:hypothetical protein
MYPIISSLIVNLPTIMAYVVASVFFFGVITFVTVCTEVVTTQERSHAGNHIVVVVVIVQVDLLIGCGSMVNWRWNYTPRREHPYINAESKM